MSNLAISADLGSFILDGGLKSAPFPAMTKRAIGTVNGTQTNITSIYFSDKIMLTISQNGQLSQWVQVPLNTASPTNFDTGLASDRDLLPLVHLTPKTLLGGGGEQREKIAQLFASQIATIIATKNPEEQRTILVGFGLGKVDLEREALFDLLELIQKVI